MNCFLLAVTLCAALHDRPVIALAAAHSAALFADGLSTRRFVAQGSREGDPAARLLIGRQPTWPRMATAGAAAVLFQTWLAERMKNSHTRFLRHTWWIPQIISIGFHSTLAVTN